MIFYRVPCLSFTCLLSISGCEQINITGTEKTVSVISHLQLVAIDTQHMGRWVWNLFLATTDHSGEEMDSYEHNASMGKKRRDGIICMFKSILRVWHWQIIQDHLKKFALLENNHIPSKIVSSMNVEKLVLCPARAAVQLKSCFSSGEPSLQCGHLTLVWLILTTSTLALSQSLSVPLPKCI